MSCLAVVASMARRQLTAPASMWFGFAIGLLCLVLVGRSSASDLCPAPSDRKALLAYWVDWQTTAVCAASDNQRVYDTLTKYGWSSGNIVEEHQDVRSDNPVMTVGWLASNLSNSSIALLDSHGTPWGELDAAYYLTSGARNTAYTTLTTTGGYTTDDLEKSTYVDSQNITSYVIYFTTTGITNHLNTMTANALIYGDYSLSAVGAGFWNATVFVGYLISPSTEVCTNREKFWSRIGCYSWPLVHRSVREAINGEPAYPLAAKLANLIHYPAEAGNWVMDCGRGCLDLAAIFGDVVAFEDTIPGDVTFGFQAYDERGSLAHTVRGFPSAAAYPDTCDTLAVVSPSGGPGMTKQYAVSVADNYHLYDVVESDSLGWSTYSSPVPITSKPAMWDSLVGRSWQDSGYVDTSPDTLYRWVQDTWQVMWPEPAAKMGDEAQHSVNTPCYQLGFCGDYILYTSSGNDALLWPVFDSLSAQGYTCQVWGGPPDGLDVVRMLYGDAVADNLAWNQGCTPPCSDLYPVDPGPTLVIIGDEAPTQIVMAMRYDHPACGSDGQGYIGCRSYSLATDWTNDGIPDGPIEVLPASNLTELLKLLKAGADVTRGRSVNAARKVIYVGGDRYAGAISPWIETFLEETSQRAEVHGLTSLPIILQSEFPIDDNNAELQTATRDAINGGVLEGWFVGLETSNERWPSWCIATISDPANLTTKQRAVVWAPGCWMGAVWRYQPNYQDPTLEKLAFNDTTKTMVAGGVFNLDRGYDDKHFAWAEILRDARMNALPGQPVSMIHYNAVQAWFDQFPGDTYVLSTFALGCRVVPSDIATDVSPSNDDAAPARAALSVVSNVGTAPRFQFSLPHAGNASLKIVDTSGRIVTILRSGELPAGQHQYTWLGRDATGEQVASGVYFGVLSTPAGAQEVAKVIIVR